MSWPNISTVTHVSNHEDRFKQRKLLSLTPRFSPRKLSGQVEVAERTGGESTVSTVSAWSREAPGILEFAPTDRRLELFRESTKENRHQRVVSRAIVQSNTKKSWASVAWKMPISSFKRTTLNPPSNPWSCTATNATQPSKGSGRAAGAFRAQIAAARRTTPAIPVRK